MAKFSTRERFIASILSATPGIKSFIKRLYITCNAIIYKKHYSYRVLDERVSEIYTPFSSMSEESFFGYYDKIPINRNLVLGHLSSNPTCKKPSATNKLYVAVSDINTGNVEIVGDTYSYTWQQGARAQWLDDNLLMFNYFDGEKYLAKVYSCNHKAIVKSFTYPVQDSFGTSYYLSLNYRRIMKLRADYGYRNLPEMGDSEMKIYDNDGIWKVDYLSGKATLINTLEEIINLDYKEVFDSCFHKVNHVMINPSGTAFMFIHRYYLGKQRFDRLIYSDFSNLKVISDNKMVSHCCWLNDETILGYFRHNDVDGYYQCNVVTGIITPCVKMAELQCGDGHPSAWREWIVFDTYPDKSRMQNLYLYNSNTNLIVPLLELYQSIKYMGECRCDLHPRFSDDGSKVFFDSVYSGKRQLAYIDVSLITKV